MGGETCASNPPRSNCETAMKELSMFHWSFMNLAYQREVLDGWREEGCFDEIFNKLGYRLRLVSAVLPSNTSSGADACFLIKFRNDGYAAPVNPRYVKLILRSSTEVYISEHIQEFTKAEPWLPESGVITVPFSLQLDVPPGQYELLLELGDPILAGNPDYNIILLNSGVVELDSAINSLGHSITVTSPTLSGSCSGFSKKFFGITTSSTLRCYSKCEDLNVRTTTSPMTSTTPSDQLPIITSHCTNNLIRNGAMDSKAGFSRKSKFRVVSEAFHGKSFRVACGKKRLGFFQIIRFDESERVRSLVAAVYSKLAKVRRRWKNTGKHSLRVDLKFSDDTKKSNINIAFEPSTDWYRNILRIEEDKDIVEATVWCRCTDKKRVALFDELALMVAPAVCET
ncbi:uncharacterized protein [Watersipora subatra]|uniref:uncharacterized protein n=1 Tax=Watersipora subatra TaxID=2589382 RepID=UPI00355C6E6F